MTKRKHDFLIFHYKNPKLWQWIDYFAMERATGGWNRYSIQGIIERARWHTADPTTGDIFKIRNSFAAYYSRLWMLTHPEHNGFFKTTRIPDDDLPDRDDYGQPQDPHYHESD